MSDIPPALDYTQTSYAVADSTGKIVVVGTIPAFMVSNQVPPTGGSLARGAADMSADYILNGVITPRPANPSTLSGVTISNVPNPSSVIIAGGSPTQVTDGEVDLSFTQPGTYAVVVSSWPALDATFSVTQS
jgi:hypothetical protein